VAVAAILAAESGNAEPGDAALQERAQRILRGRIRGIALVASARSKIGLEVIKDSLLFHPRAGRVGPLPPTRKGFGPNRHPRAPATFSRMKGALLLILAFAAASARAGALGDLCRQSGGADCDAPRGYVHAAGWIVDGNCLRDKRFTPAQFRAALDEAARKFSPNVPVSKGGCLADYNPAWAKEITTFLHANPVRITCPAYDPKSRPCADHTKMEGSGGEIRVLNAGPCLAEEGTGLVSRHEPRSPRIRQHPPVPRRRELRERAARSRAVLRLQHRVLRHGAARLPQALIRRRHASASARARRIRTRLPIK
jgi:hypothetical protein